MKPTRLRGYQPLREAHRAGVAVQVADIDLFHLSADHATITVGGHLTGAERRCALTVALAHRSLGHRGSSLAADVEARNLAVAWLLPDEDIVDAVAAVGIDYVALAEFMGVTPNTVRVRLSIACEHLSNWQLYRGAACGCAVRLAA